MSKKYSESLPSELGTLRKTDWRWFTATLNKETWYTNGHVAMTVPPVKVWPTEPPKGMSYRIGYFQSPITLPITQASLDRTDKLLSETGRTERTGKVGSDYKPGVVYLKDADGVEHFVARHYHALVAKKFPLAFPYGGTQKDPIVYREADNTLVAILMPIRV